jgi:uncharacterized protein (UPF0210 family)
MKIRSITYFCDPGWPLDENKLKEAGEFLAEARAAYQAGGYEVESTRLATVPFLQILGADKIGQAPRLAEEMEKAIQATGIDYAALGPVEPEILAGFKTLPEAIAATENIFFSGIMADSRFGISVPALQACAEVITRCSTITLDGFANLRFAALANVKPGAPFFPAAYHNHTDPAFAVATEAADLAVTAFGDCRSVSDGQWAMARELEKHTRQLTSVGDMLGQKHSMVFSGIDFSLAPYPSEAASIGAAMEKLGVLRVGLHGSLAAAAILTECLERARYRRTGFSGLMLPVLEDSVLAQRAAEGTLTVRDLLLYSAVCGTGLDTVPLPGDTTAEQISAVLMDLSALALRLDKSLTARLMPIPGKTAGEPTDFNFSYFANSRVMALEAEPLKPPLADSRRFTLAPRRI